MSEKVTICVECSNYVFTKGWSDPRDSEVIPDKHQCKLPGKMNYVTGEKLFTFADCTKKNTRGECPDYIHK